MSKPNNVNPQVSRAKDAPPSTPSPWNPLDSCRACGMSLRICGDKTQWDGYCMGCSMRGGWHKCWDCGSHDYGEEMWKIDAGQLWVCDYCYQERVKATRAGTDDARRPFLIGNAGVTLGEVAVSDDCYGYVEEDYAPLTEGPSEVTEPPDAVRRIVVTSSEVEYKPGIMDWLRQWKVRYTIYSIVSGAIGYAISQLL